ncbi:MAG: hypothetical protein AAFR79_17905, partial [Pseudomonadota bacterium]
GETHVGAMDGVIRDRLKLARQGHVVISVVADEDGELIADPEVRVIGGPQEAPRWPAPLDEMIAQAIDEAIDGTPPKSRRSDAALEDLVMKAARRVCSRQWGKKPVTTVLLTRLEEED